MFIDLVDSGTKNVFPSFTIKILRLIEFEACHVSAHFSHAFSSQKFPIRSAVDAKASVPTPRYMLIGVTITRCTAIEEGWDKILAGLGQCAYATSVENCVHQLLPNFDLYILVDCKVVYSKFCHKKLGFPHTDANRDPTVWHQLHQERVFEYFYLLLTVH